jgi:hypothetical protein
VRVRDVAFLEIEMHLKRFVRNAIEATQVEFSCFIGTK